MKQLFILFLLLIHYLYAVGVPAGTSIENVAHLHYSVGDSNFTINSNKVVDIVDQKIDMKMSCQESSPVIVGVSETKRVLTFKITNIGNGADSYNFIAENRDDSTFEVLNKKIYLDNGDGIFTETIDFEVNDLNLSADRNATLFLVADIPAEASAFSYNGIKVNSKLQENLNYGEAKNLGDYYAVMVAKENALVDFCAYELSPLGITLHKTATLSSDELYVGSTIHYSIAVKVTGTGVVTNVDITDVIPHGTVYVPNTLQLDGVAFGDFNGTAINVKIPKIEQSEESNDSKHIVSFDVKVI